MKIKLIPQRRNDSLTLSKEGDVLYINGQALDLALIPNGATLSHEAVDSEFVCGDIARSYDGEVSLNLILPIGYIPDPAPEGALVVMYPADLNVVDYGDIPLPYWNYVEDVA